MVLADEPTGNLDESTRDEIISLLDDMWRSRGLTLVLVTQDSTIAGRAQRIGLMRKRPAGHQAGHQARRQLTEPGPVAGPLPARAGHGRPRFMLNGSPGQCR